MTWDILILLMREKQRELRGIRNLRAARIITFILMHVIDNFWMWLIFEEEI